jgi:hypothetical protein
MTKETAIKMIESKLLCAACEIVGASADCDNCRLNYEQGNLGEQQEWLAMALTALKEPERVHAHWIDSPNVPECVVCSNCLSDELSAQVIVPAPEWYKYCPCCGARMDEEE